MLHTLYHLRFRKPLNLYCTVSYLRNSVHAQGHNQDLTDRTLLVCIEVFIWQCSPLPLQEDNIPLNECSLIYLLKKKFFFHIMAKLSVIHANIEPYNSHAGLLEPGTLKQGFARNSQCQREALWDPFKWEAETSLQKPQKWVREWDCMQLPLCLQGGSELLVWRIVWRIITH